MGEWVEYMTFGGISPMSEWRAQNGRKEPWRLKYFGIGNENWGCGGCMRPEYYADEYRRYQTYVRNYGDNKIAKIACGSSGLDYDWTEKVMAAAGKYMDAITLHWYTIPTGNWDQKGSATGFSEQEYYQTIVNCLKIEELISNHLQIMNRYDPAHRVGLVVDEWGTWYDVEPGTNPGFLYQQNTMRDAVVAAATLNIFNACSDRVVMANLAQTVNVLQAVIQTDGPKMLLTPTYHVFDLYKAHQGAALADSFIEQEYMDFDGQLIPKLSASASINATGELNITAANLSLSEAAPVDCEVAGMDMAAASARLLTGQVGACNTFKQPDAITIEDTEAKLSGGRLYFTIPPNSVIHVSAR